MIDVRLSIKWTVLFLDECRRRRSIKMFDWMLIPFSDRIIFNWTVHIFMPIKECVLRPQLATKLCIKLHECCRLIQLIFLRNNNSIESIWETYLFLQSRPPMYSKWFFCCIFSFISFILIKITNSTEVFVTIIFHNSDSS